MDSGTDSEVLHAAVEWLDQGASITLSLWYVPGVPRPGGRAR